MFDTVWAAALALNEIAKQGYSLADFHYMNENLSDVIYNETLKVNFFGLTVSYLLNIEYYMYSIFKPSIHFNIHYMQGEVYFNNTTGDRVGRIRYLQYRGTYIIKVLCYYYYYYYF